MSIFSFIKDKGAKLIGIDDGSRGEKLTEEIIGSGLNVDNFKVEIKDSTATVSGVAINQAVKEKIILMVGNKDGISEVHNRMTVKVIPKPAAEPAEMVEEEPSVEEVEPRFYTVKAGDTLSHIAKAYYGDAMKYPVIFEANRPMLKDPNEIYVGQTLRIPEEGATNPRLYTVKKGDTLSHIAKAYYGDAMKYPVIFEANRPLLTDPNIIQIGQVLIIPELN